MFHTSIRDIGSATLCDLRGPAVKKMILQIPKLP